MENASSLVAVLIEYIHAIISHALPPSITTHIGVELVNKVLHMFRSREEVVAFVEAFKGISTKAGAGTYHMRDLDIKAWPVQVQREDSVRKRKVLRQFSRHELEGGIDYVNFEQALARILADAAAEEAAAAEAAPTQDAVKGRERHGSHAAGQARSRPQRRRGCNDGRPCKG